MQTNSQNENRTLKDKIRELTGIAFLIIIAAVISIVISDLTVYPFTLFSINNVDIFNVIFKIFILFLIVIFVIAKFYKSLKRLKNDNTGFKNILLYFSLRPFHYITLFLSFLLISAFLIFLLYSLYSLNYYYLYKISGGI